jgi:hypothetical protein
MHRMNNINFAKAQQAKSVDNCKNRNSYVLYYEGHWLDNKLVEKKINTANSDASSRIIGLRSSLSHLPQKVYTNFPT